MTYRILACALLLGAALATAAATTAQAGYPDACCAYHNATLWYPWHGSYYDPAWGGSPVVRSCRRRPCSRPSIAGV